MRRARRGKLDSFTDAQRNLEDPIGNNEGAVNSTLAW